MSIGRTTEFLRLPGWSILVCLAGLILINSIVPVSAADVDINRSAFLRCLDQFPTPSLWFYSLVLIGLIAIVVLISALVVACCQRGCRRAHYKHDKHYSESKSRKRRDD